MRRMKIWRRTLGESPAKMEEVWPDEGYEPDGEGDGDEEDEGRRGRRGRTRETRKTKRERSPSR